MGLFKSKYERELDSIIMRLNMDMSNNYKDNAQEDLRELEAKVSEFKGAGLLTGRSLDRYEEQVHAYVERLKGYSHKDQKPYWTK